MTKNNEKDAKVVDTPSFQELSSMLPTSRFVSKAAKILSKIGFKNERISKVLKHVSDIENMSHIITLPDRFNEAFSDAGWIATSSLSTETMENAYNLHMSGNQDAAQNEIINWFSKETIELHAIRRARSFHKASQRDEQLKEALKLYCEERYLAAVPLILIACDGFASDVAGGQNVFKEGADLTCFDSIAGHQTSLAALVKGFSKSVQKSSDQSIDIPLRHGILHGRSLGYANKVACTKAWLLMIALVDWAHDLKTEEERIKNWEEKRNIGFRDLLKKLAENQKSKRLMDEFETFEVANPKLEHAEENSPEHAVLNFLEGWKERNYGRMASHVINYTQKSIKTLAGELRRDAEFVELLEFEVLKVHHVTIARSESHVRVIAKTARKNISGDFKLLIFLLRPDGHMAMPDDMGASWKVQQNCIFNVMHGKVIS